MLPSLLLLTSAEGLGVHIILLVLMKYLECCFVTLADMILSLSLIRTLFSVNNKFVIVKGCIN